MKRAALLAILASAFAVALAFADGSDPVRMSAPRFSARGGVEQMVLSFGQEAAVEWRSGPESGEETFFIAAKPAKPSQIFPSKLPLLGQVVVTETRNGAVISLEPRERQVRAYWLDSPARLVIEAAPRGASLSALPRDARLIAPLAPPPAVVAKIPVPPRRVTPTKPPAPSDVAKPLAKPKTPALLSQLEPVRAFVAPYWRLGGLAVLALLALALLARVSRRGRGSKKSPVPQPAVAPRSRSSEAPGIFEIAPEEIGARADREEMLEKRLDEEVRARQRLEERFQQTSEELKLLRDRINRIERRREPA